MKKSIRVSVRKEAELSAEDNEPPSLTPPSEGQSYFSKQLFQELIPFHPVRRETSTLKICQRSLQFLQKYYPGTSQQDWNSWEWQLTHSVTSIEELKRVLPSASDFVSEETNLLPLRITPYYASLIDPDDPADPLKKCMVPQAAENIISVDDAIDPLGEDHDSPVPGLVHRYPDRVLFLSTGFCAAYCRYCTRSRLVGGDEKCHYGREQWERALAYIELNPQVRDVVISGGDPLTLTDERIEYLLTRISRIPHVEMIRLGTKAPVVLPQRITNGLIRILKRFRPLWMSIHFTHPREITRECSQAVERIADAGIPMGSQTVLLKGINDDADVMKKLFHELLKIRVRPYYLYQCDPIVGSSHFRTPVAKGLEIIEKLRGHTSGYAIPHYVIDAPGGGGKIPLIPDYFQGIGNDGVHLRNYEGKHYIYPQRIDG